MAQKIERMSRLMLAGDLVNAEAWAAITRMHNGQEPDLDALSRRIAYFIAVRRVMYKAGDLSAAVISAYADKICAELAEQLPHQDVPVRSPEHSHDH